MNKKQTINGRSGQENIEINQNLRRVSKTPFFFRNSFI